MESAVAVVEPDGPVVVVRPGGGDASRVELTRGGFWPTWDPSGSGLAVPTLHADGGNVASTVELFEPLGVHRSTLFRQVPGSLPAIGPRIPGYACWAPTGKLISYVTAGKEGLTLFAVDSETSGMQNPVLGGAPIFSSWSPDGSTLAAHAGSNLTLLQPAVNAVPLVVTEEAAGFRTPAYSDGGILIYAVVEDGAVRLKRRDPAGTTLSLADFPGGLAFGFRPHTSELTIAMTHSPGNGLFDELSTINIDDPAAPHLVARGPFTGFFWSPAGDRMILVIPAQTGDGRYYLQALTPEGRYAGTTEGFVPSQDFRTYLGFFDQFSLSHHLWSPDSNTFLVAGRMLGDSVHSDFGDPVRSNVLRWRVGRGHPLEAICPGEIGVYPPPPRG